MQTCILNADMRTADLHIKFNYNKINFFIIDEHTADLRTADYGLAYKVYLYQNVYFSTLMNTLRTADLRTCI